MKGLIAIAFCLLSLGASASLGHKGALVAIEISSGEVIKNLTREESANVLKSIDEGENLELRQQIIYPEEVAQLFFGGLTKGKFVERRPNPQDYN